MSLLSKDASASSDENQNNLFELFFNQLHIVAFRSLIDENFSFDYITPNLFDFTGHEHAPKDNGLFCVLNLIRGNDKEILTQKIVENLKAGHPINEEFSIRSKSGELVWVKILTSTVLPSQQKSYFNGILINITQDKKKQMTVDSEKLSVFQTSRTALIKQISSGVAHEVNNPLTIILAKAERMLMNMESGNFNPQTEQEDLKKIIKAGNRISKIVKSLKFISRSGEQDPITKYPISHLIQESLNIVHENLNKNEIKIDVQADEACVISCRPIELEQAMLNLLNNAIDAVIPLNEKWINIIVTPSAHFCEISITDSGSGIADSISSRLGEPFFTTKPVGQGSGLGLNISKKLIENNGGRLFYDKKNKNTRFVLQLPWEIGMTLIALNVDDAIETHFNWKQRLSDYFKKPVREQTFIPSEVSDDHRCSLGKWLYENKKQFESSNKFHTLVDTHAKFHRHAGELISKVNSGQKLEEHIILGPRSTYDDLSKSVVAQLLDLKNEIESKS